MNKKEFSVYLHKPHLIDKHAEIALQEVITDFPYFQAAHQLLLKAHQNNGSYHFERQLPITSLLHGNRALLYAYLKDTLVKEIEEAAKLDSSAAEEILATVNREEANEILLVDEILIEATVEIEEKPPLTLEKLPVISNELPNNNTQEKPEISEPEKTPEPPQTSHRTEDQEMPFQNYDKKYLEKISEEEGVVETKIPKLKHETIEEKSNELPLSDAEQKIISSIEPHDFLSWLQAKKSHVEPNPKPIEKAYLVKPVEELTPDSNDTENALVEKRIKKYNSLIDKFIENSPSISKPQPTKFYNPAQKAKESITENFDLATETLAKIYMKQNNYKKAILVYEKLSLLYPEKISYFAAQISELQTLLNK